MWAIIIETHDYKRVYRDLTYKESLYYFRKALQEDKEKNNLVAVHFIDESQRKRG